MMAFFLFSKTHAQYSCQTATQLIVKDSLELDTFSHSGYDDRWFTFSLTDSVSHIEFQWEWASKNTIVPYDSLIIYTNNCNQLNQYIVLSPVPLSKDLHFSGISNVFFQFKRADNAPQVLEFDMSVFNVNCLPPCNFHYPSLSLSPNQNICCGNNLTIANSTTDSYITSRNGVYLVVVKRFVSSAPVSLSNFFSTPGSILTQFEWHASPGNQSFSQSVMIPCASLYPKIYVFVIWYEKNAQGQPITQFPCICDGNQQFLHPVIKNIIPSVTTSSNPSNICIGQSSNLTATGSAIYSTISSYNWNTGQSGTQIQVTPNTTTTYTVSATTPEGCYATSNVIVQVSNFQFEINATPNPVCVGQEVDFDITSLNCNIPPNASFLWSFGDGFTSIDQTPQHTYSQSGDYHIILTISSPLGNYSAQQMIQVLYAPDIEFVSGSNMACSPDNTWSLNLNDPEYTYSWYVWADVNGVYDIVYEETDVGETFTFDWLPDYPNGGTIQAYVYSHETQCHSVAYFEVYPCCDDNEFNADYIWTDETISGGGTYTDRTFIINGNVTLVDDLHFSLCKFYFAPYSTLYLGDKSKIFTETKFTNCRDTVWKEIQVLEGEGPIVFANDTIEFSEQGITMPVERPLSISTSKFFNNFLKSVEISNWGNLPSHYIASNQFLCTNPADMIFPYNNMYPEKGIFLNNNTILNDYIIIGNDNFFSNLQNGIYSINSNVKVIGNNFENIDHFDQFNPNAKEIYKFAAIYAEGNNKQVENSIIVGGIDNDYNDFIDCINGVFVNRNYHALITYNNFSDRLNGTAIRLQNMEGYNSGIYFYPNIGYVYNNTINEVGIGVSASCNKRAVIDIEHNTINCFQQQNHISRGIVINGLKSIREKYFVRNNVINHATFGISANNTYAIFIEKNNIISLKQHPLTGRFGRGIHLTGSERGTIYSNNVIGASLPSTIKTIGIHIESSMLTEVLCDSLVDLGAGFRASFICTDSRVFNNKFRNSQEGITLSNGGIIGPQGALNQPSDNEWLPTVADWTSVGRWPHYTYASDGQQSTLFVKQGLLYPTFGILWDYYATDQSSGGTTFLVNPNASGVSGITCDNPVTPSPKEELDLVVIKELINEMIYFPVYEEEAYERAKGEFLYFLPEDSLAMADSDIQAFVQLMETEPKGISVEVHRLTEEEEYELARTLNLSIQTLTLMEDIERTVRAILINFLENNSLTSDEIQQLELIAPLCPYTHGQGVYIARSLLSTIDPHISFISDCETDPNFRPRTLQIAATEPQMHVYPNPASDIVFFELKNAEINEPAKVQITDITGKTLLLKTTDIVQFNSVDVSALANGCYSFSIILRSGQTFSEKICLIR